MRRFAELLSAFKLYLYIAQMFVGVLLGIWLPWALQMIPVGVTIIVCFALYSLWVLPIIPEISSRFPAWVARRRTIFFSNVPLALILLGVVWGVWFQSKITDDDSPSDNPPALNSIQGQNNSGFVFNQNSGPITIYSTETIMSAPTAVSVPSTTTPTPHVTPEPKYGVHVSRIDPQRQTSSTHAILLEIRAISEPLWGLRFDTTLNVAYTDVVIMQGKPLLQGTISQINLFECFLKYNRGLPLGTTPVSGDRG